MRLFFSCVSALFVWVSTVTAQEQDSVFADYETYAAFVDRHITQRDFIPLIQRLGGRDEFSSDQLVKLQSQFINAWPQNFRDTAVFRQVDLGGGLKQEGRMYWTGTSYGFYYALLHQRPEALVVINFKLNTDVDAIMASF